MKLICNIKKCDHRKKTTDSLVGRKYSFGGNISILPRSNLSADLFCKNFINYLRFSRLLFADCSTLFPFSCKHNEFLVWPQHTYDFVISALHNSPFKHGA